MPSARGRSVAAHAAAPFDGSASSDPDDGDRLSYAWSFDDGGTAVGPLVTHAFAAPGLHQASLTVTDPTGLSSTGITYIQIVAEPLAPQSPGATHRTPPIVSGLAFSPSSFAVGPRPTAVSAETQRRASRRGDRRRASKRSRQAHDRDRHDDPLQPHDDVDGDGRDRPHRQRPQIPRPLRRHGARRGRPCTLTTPVGTITRRAVRAGRVSLAFSGRIGTKALAPGTYVATVTARNTVGTKSRAASARFTIVGPSAASRR